VIVVDCNVIGYLLLPGDQAMLARRVFECDPDWVAPPLWRSEFYNVVAKFLRTGKITYAEAERAMLTASQIVRDTTPPEPPKLLALIRISKCSSYDLEYAFTSSDLSVSLVTRDAELLEEFPGNAITMEEFVNSRGK
jgi:predicted nucleic acid-binding protein